MNSTKWDNTVQSKDSAMFAYRYVPGQKFGQHYDDAVQTADGETAYTLLIYLNGKDGGDGNALVGGSTVFYGACLQNLGRLHSPASELQLGDAAVV